MTISITAVPELTYGLPPAVALTVTTSPATTEEFELVRIHEDGSEYPVIVSLRQQLIGGGWADRDYHAPFNQQLTYQVRAGSQSATGTAYVAWDSAWLISADRPELSFPIRVKNITDRSESPRATAHRPIGGPLVAISDGLQTWDGVSTNLIIEMDDEGPLHRLKANDPVVLINTPGAGWRIGWMWALLGQVGYSNPGRAHWRSELITLPVTEVAPPDVDLVTPWNAGTMAATFAAEGKTAGDIVTLYADALALVTDTRL